MRRSICAVAVVLAMTLAAPASDEPTLPELIKRADSAPLGDRPSLYLEIAERQLKAADDLYKAGKVDDAGADVGEVVTYSERAHDAAVRSGKRLKNTEIALRKMSHRLRDIKRTLSFEDQTPAEAAAERLQSLADDLLAHMFGKGK